MGTSTRAGDIRSRADWRVGTKVVLLIEDDEVTREVYARVLREAGFLVSEAIDGRDALDQLVGGLKPNLILLDMMLPDVDGWRLLEAKRRAPELAEIPVVIITAIGIASPAWAVSLGAVGLLHKPVEGDDLVKTVEHWCQD